MNVVEIEHLTYAYPGAAEATLNDVSLTIEKGDFLAIVGNNGCGKSTLCKTLNGLIPQFITGEYTGRVTACGLDAATTDIGALAQKVGYVYQDFENQIIRPTVLDDASYACLNYARPDYLERGREALRQCGLQDREDDFIWQLSGGQTHLLALAGVLSLQPEVLILDEPIAQLDPQHADRIDVCRELRHVEADLDMSLGREVVNFIRPYTADDRHQAHRIAEVAEMQVEAGVALKMGDPLAVIDRGTADDAVNVVAFFQQELGQIAAVLAGDAGDQCFFHSGTPFAVFTVFAAARRAGGEVMHILAKRRAAAAWRQGP